MAGIGLAAGVLVGACTTNPPNQAPEAVTPVTTVTSTPTVTVTATPPVAVAPTVTSPSVPPKVSTARKSPWRCEPGYPNCTKAQSEKYLAELEYQKCVRDPEKIWDTQRQKCRYKTSGEVQSEYFNGPIG